MFCDVVGSTELAARLGAETWGEVVGAYQAFGGKCVERYEGYLAQVLGDGLLVYFGYPQAHEDDAERAVRCALEIRDGLPALNQRLEAESGVRLAARLGVHTGPVVVEEVGAKGRREILAIGDTANVAARLQEKAAADSVVLSEDTLRLVPGVFLTNDLGALSLKGIPCPLRAYSVLGSTVASARR